MSGYFVLMDINVIFEIFSNFTRTELVNLFSVCKRWSSLAESDALWGVMARNKYGVDAKIATKGRGGRQLFDSFYYSKISPLGLISHTLGHPELIDDYDERKRAKRVCRRVGISTFYIQNLISPKRDPGDWSEKDYWEIIEEEDDAYFKRVIHAFNIKTIHITGHTLAKAKGVHRVIWRMKLLRDCTAFTNVHFATFSPNTPSPVHYVWSFDPHQKGISNAHLAQPNEEWFDLEIGIINIKNVGDRVTFSITQFNDWVKKGLIIN
eukprot:TRINITY_DN1710_c0_g1_i4.p1 TRINITY_DN1710_c0_g1~~TRINITY_DN1710_c0_g1_i4.p1  ORF type:complete len:265 (-),score=42.14 TRINITY_DN1710_c0_g1_i4:66-860(-)